MCLFKKYFKKYLKESPLHTGRYYPDPITDSDYNIFKESEDIVAKYKFIETINTSRDFLHLYEDYNKEDNIHYWYFISYTNFKKPLLVSYFYFRKQENIAYSLGIWNRVQNPGMFMCIFKEYLLKKFKIIISDKEESTQAMNFWKKMIKYGLDNKKEVGILQNNKFTILSNTSEFDYHDAWSQHSIQIYIKNS